LNYVAQKCVLDLDANQEVKKPKAKKRKRQKRRKDKKKKKQTDYEYDYDSGEDTEIIVSGDDDKNLYPPLKRQNAMDAKELRVFFGLPEK
jgi:hypothetical protein